MQVQTSHVASVLSTLLAKSSICYNPVIYASLNVQFCRAWKKMLFGDANTRRTNKASKDNTRMVIMN